MIRLAKMVWKSEEEILREMEEQEKEKKEQEMTPTPEERIEMLEQAIMFLSTE